MQRWHPASASVADGVQKPDETSRSLDTIRPLCLVAEDDALIGPTFFVTGSYPAATLLAELTAAARLLSLGIKQIPVVGGMLDLGQLEECAQDIKMEKGFMIFALLA